MSYWKRLSAAPLTRWCLAVSLMLCWPASSASAQAITSYEITLTPQGGFPPFKTLTAPALNVTCVTGRAPAPQTVWLVGTDPFKVLFEPDDTRVCTWLGPTVSTLGFTTGLLYTAAVVAVNEAGLRSVTPSPASNPFGLAGPPPNIRRVAVPGGN